MSVYIGSDTYISPLLIKTLAKHKVPILSQNKKLTERLRDFTEDLIILRKNESNKLFLKSNSLIYTSSEDALPFLLKNSNDQSLIRGIKLFKNKSQMRLLLKKFFPDFFFLEVEKEKLKDVDLPSDKTYIIKPSVGFFSICIRKIKNKKDLNEKIDGMFSEIEKYSKMFDINVINSDKFLIEEYLTGKEFACDAYFDSKGVPVILCISLHPFLNEDDFRDIVYYTSSRIMYEMSPKERARTRVLINTLLVLPITLIIGKIP